MTKKIIHKSVIITGLLCITALMIVALALGYNGTLLAVVIGLIGAVIGITIPTPTIK